MITVLNVITVELINMLWWRVSLQKKSATYYDRLA